MKFDIPHVERVANAMWKCAVREADGDIQTLAYAFLQAHVQVVIAAKMDPELIDDLLQEYVVEFKKSFIHRNEHVQ